MGNSKSRYEERIAILKKSMRDHVSKQRRENVDVFEARAEQTARGRVRVSLAIRHRLVIVGAIVLIAVAASAAVIGIRDALREAAELRGRLDALRETVGLTDAFDVTFHVEDANRAVVAPRIDPALVRSVAVSYDQGLTYRQLYQIEGEPTAAGALGRLLHLPPDSHEYELPRAGSRRERVLVRAEFMADVVRAFPEYAEAEQTERAGEFVLKPDGMAVLATVVGKPVRAMGTVPLESARWEVIVSEKAASATVQNTDDGALEVAFNLDEVGEWVHIGHAVPGASPSEPDVSLDELTTIEIQLYWNGQGAICLEPKLEDFRGRTSGRPREVEPMDAVQTLRIPAPALRDWDEPIDISRARRIGLAVVRKSRADARAGTLRIERIELLGTSELPPPFVVSRDEPETLLEVPLDADKWATYEGNKGKITKHNETRDGREWLICDVDLPHVEGKALPWTTIEMAFGELQDVGGAQALELEFEWTGDATATVEPYIRTSERQDRYGRHIWVRQGAGVQTLQVPLQDLKFYDSVAAANERTRMDLSRLKAVGLGIAAKAKDQTNGGVFRIRAIRLLGPTKPR